MEFIYGLLTAVVFFIALLFFFYLGIRYERKKPTPKASEQEKRDMQKIHNDLVKLMQYDVSTALQKKKVT